VLIRALADTGTLLAYLDRSDRWHERCRAVFPDFRLSLVTTEAVLTELFHLTAEHPGEIDIIWGFIRSGALTIAPIDDQDLPDIESLMHKYRDRPMDLADATLVHLAQRDSLSSIFTIDHNDFQTCRIDGRKRFRILPAPY